MVGGLNADLVSGQSQGAVTYSWQTTPKDTTLSTWATRPENAFWAAVYAEKYGGLDTSVDSISGIRLHDNIIRQGGWNLQVREELDRQAEEVVALYADYGLIYRDEFLEDELFKSKAAVFPGQLPPGRTGSIKIFIAADLSPNAFSLSDGTIIINAGLLTALRSNAELQAIIAHEIAHVVMDHSVTQLLQERQSARVAEERARRRAATVGLIGAIAAGVGAKSIGLDPSSVIRSSTSIGLAVGGATYQYQRSVAGKLLLESGALFSRSQETEADRVAVEWLRRNNLPEDALAVALSRLDSLRSQTRSSQESRVYATHPEIGDRLNYAYARSLKWSGGVIVSRDPDKYELDKSRLVSTIDHTFDNLYGPLLYETARMLIDDYWDYRSAESYLERLFQNGYPNTSAYVLMSRSLRFKGGQENVEAAQEVINKAFDVAYEPTWDMLLEKAVLNRRLGDYTGSTNALQDLLNMPEEKKPMANRWLTRYWERLVQEDQRAKSRQ